MRPGSFDVLCGVIGIGVGFSSNGTRWHTAKVLVLDQKLNRLLTRRGTFYGVPHSHLTVSKLTLEQQGEVRPPCAARALLVEVVMKRGRRIWHLVKPFTSKKLECVFAKRRIHCVHHVLYFFLFKLLFPPKTQTLKSCRIAGWFCSPLSLTETALVEKYFPCSSYK